MSVRSRGKSPHGFTLVELLVVIAIIGVLVALLLPAVQAAREASRRSSCSNNIKQLGLALHNYHDTMLKFPLTGYLAKPDNSAYHHTWLTSILPFMEQRPLYEKTNMNNRAWGQPIVSTKLKNLLCPSDGGYDEAKDTHNIAITNYAGAEGYHWWPTAGLDPAWGGNWTQLPSAGDYTGLFAITRVFDMAGISDGTSNTVIVAECDSYGYKNGPFQSQGGGVRRNRGGEAVFRAAFVFPPYTGQSVQSPYKKPDDTAAGDGAWFVAGPHSYSPSYLTAWGMNCDWPGASSQHSGSVVLSLRADGSVSNLTKNLPWGMWVAMNGVADNATIREN